ncbi:MAG: DNA-binding protein [Candidatus Nanopelagicaceae bacterium]|nr:DNA-binding protein [Candidatus Nanopelagicaceae bacterium]
MNVLSRPKLRGIIHLVMSPLALVAGLTLVTITSELRGRVTLTIFTLTAVSLFTCSAIYHRVPWSPAAKAVWRRIDHANIPLLIAGTYTPFSIYLLEKQQAVILLTLVWGGALLSGIFRVFWINAPKWLYVPIYLALGWAAFIYFPDFYESGGLLVFSLIALGGVLYSAGAIIYAVKKPNFSINWFGFHELFHALTAAAFISHFIAAVLVIVR